MDIITFDKVSKLYPGEKKPALEQVSFSIEQGEFVVLIGASGCGKTTILKLIAGLDEPTGGSIVKPPRIAMAFQAGALLPWLTVYENVALGLHGMSASDADRVVTQELKAMGIAPFAKKYPHELSGGQRQRVGIARALAVDPDVLLLDEPFSALDAKTTAELHDDIIALWRRTGKTVVLVSHLIEEAVSLGQRIMLVRDGIIDATYSVMLPYPRRESADFHGNVMKIRRAFFR